MKNRNRCIRVSDRGLDDYFSDKSFRKPSTDAYEVLLVDVVRQVVNVIYL